MVKQLQNMVEVWKLNDLLDGILNNRNWIIHSDKELFGNIYTKIGWQIYA